MKKCAWTNNAYRGYALTPGSTTVHSQSSSAIHAKYILKDTSEYCYAQHRPASPHTPRAITRHLAQPCSQSRLQSSVPTDWPTTRPKWYQYDGNGSTQSSWVDVRGICIPRTGSTRSNPHNLKKGIRRSRTLYLRSAICTQPLGISHFGLLARMLHSL